MAWTGIRICRISARFVSERALFPAKCTLLKKMQPDAFV
jgi:hypothetical protein